ncbi:hypothetical protein FB567DRAFT_576611 [Paraphoma chrysanthemicola]|uniref:Uncharacterized protein n=1 Tax=Paraphoma chrysanthemicola TaxID=798071 RepID=A0A8K0RE59_9PLEO|nr:hypothetical protein FB567DRAFT_576611 [Paraphoma chrysanthemicola]
MVSHRVTPLEFNNFTVISGLVKALYPPVNNRHTHVLVSRQAAKKGVDGFDAAVVWYDLGEMTQGKVAQIGNWEESGKDSKEIVRDDPKPTLHPIHGPFRGKSRIEALHQLLAAVEIEAQSRMPETVKAGEEDNDEDGTGEVEDVSEVPSSPSKKSNAKKSPDNKRKAAQKKEKGEPKANSKAKPKTNVRKRTQDEAIADDIDGEQPAPKKSNRTRSEAKTQNSSADTIEPEPEVQGKKGRQSKIEKEQAESKPQPTAKGKGKVKIKKEPVEALADDDELDETDAEDEDEDASEYDCEKANGTGKKAGA